MRTKPHFRLQTTYLVVSIQEQVHDVAEDVPVILDDQGL